MFEIIGEKESPFSYWSRHVDADPNEKGRAMIQINQQGAVRSPVERPNNLSGS